MSGRTGAIKAIFVKEFRHIFRDIVSCLLLFIMPAVILVMFGYALSFEVHHHEVAVLCVGPDAAAERLFERIDANPKLKVTQRLDRYDQIGEAMTKGNTRAVIIYSGDGVELYLDGSSPAFSIGVRSTIEAVISDFILDENRVPESVRPEINVRYLYNPASNREYMSVPGLVLMIFILVSSIALGTSMNKEKINGTFKLLRLTPVTNIQLIIGKALPYFLISLVHIAAIYFICGYFHIQIVGSVALFLLICILFTLCCQSLGLLIAAWFDRPLDVVILSWIVLFIPNVFLSGFVFPTTTMEGVIRLMAECLPGTSFIDAFRSVAYMGCGFGEILKPVIILLGETAAAVLLSLPGMKRELMR